MSSESPVDRRPNYRRSTRAEHPEIGGRECHADGALTWLPRISRCNKWPLVSNTSTKPEP